MILANRRMVFSGSWVFEKIKGELCAFAPYRVKYRNWPLCGQERITSTEVRRPSKRTLIDGIEKGRLD